ncbi:hypothetical protein EPN15_00035 [Patescibacteria group bacterium]|nr:MAG: hypothetical protein EPN15_00035 [Patescibacteria group bacterium]
MKIFNLKIIHSSLGTALIILFCTVVLAFGLRGLPGNPTADDLNAPSWKDSGPLELSPERGRFALLYSLIEDGSLQFSLPIARFATPDLGITPDGHYVSLFAPAVSFVVMPGYIIGKFFGASQVGTFAVIALFAIFNVLLIRAIAIRLGADKIAAAIGALIFLFATPAFTYAVTLYQHHISVFIILLSIYLLIRWNNFWSLASIWLLIALSAAIDNPNVIFMAPIGLYAAAKMFIINKEPAKINIRFRKKALVALIGALVPIVLFLWFNQASHGNPLKLSGTLASVKEIDASGSPMTPPLADNPSKAFDPVQKGKSAIGFFETRDLLNGFYIHLFSPDRGIIFYAPVILLGLWGFLFLLSANKTAGNILIAVGGAVFLLYSMWGDPWGGWAFGSRYMIPFYAILAIGLSFVIARWKNNYLFIIIFLPLLAYSVWVNTMGAITSSRNPPQVEVLALEKLSGREEKYTFARNLQYLDGNDSKSFVFQQYGKNIMNARQYHWTLTVIIFACLLGLIVWYALVKHKDSSL